MPVLIMVMVNFFLESSAISMASKGELPNSKTNSKQETVAD